MLRTFRDSFQDRRRDRANPSSVSWGQRKLHFDWQLFFLHNVHTVIRSQRQPVSEKLPPYGGCTETTSIESGIRTSTIREVRYLIPLGHYGSEVVLRAIVFLQIRPEGAEFFRTVQFQTDSEGSWVGIVTDSCLRNSRRLIDLPRLSGSFRILPQHNARYTVPRVQVGNFRIVRRRSQRVHVDLFRQTRVMISVDWKSLRERRETHHSNSRSPCSRTECGKSESRVGKPARKIGRCRTKSEKQIQLREDGRIEHALHFVFDYHVA